MFKLKRTVASLLLLACLMFAPSQTFAWGSHGHRIVALVAMNYVKPGTQDEVTRLLRDEDLADVANWADQVRPDRPETAPWHFVDIPLADDTFDPNAAYCKDEGDTDACVVKRLEVFRQVISNPNATRRQRREALEFIVHFMGDLHQPLHDADNNDRGGNNVRVKFFGVPTNLHHVWDSDMIARTGLDDAEYASALIDEFDNMSSADQNAMRAGNPAQWAIEAHKLARSNAYGLLANNRRIGRGYFDKNISIIDLQLLRGGVRLARFLDANLVGGS